MKKILLALTLIASISTFAKDSKKKPFYVPGEFQLDNAHTRVSFKVSHFVISYVEGRFNEVHGAVNFNKDFKKSSLNVSIPIKSIDTAIEQRDNHLKSPDFFDEAKFPLMTFKSKSFKGKAKDFTVIGDLTIKNVTKEVKFEGEFLGTITDSWGNTRNAFELEGKINRKDFNVNYDDKFDLGPVVGHEVKIKIITEGVLSKK